MIRTPARCLSGTQSPPRRPGHPEVFLGTVETRPGERPQCRCPKLRARVEDPAGADRSGEAGAWLMANVRQGQRPCRPSGATHPSFLTGDQRPRGETMPTAEFRASLGTVCPVGTLCLNISAYFKQFVSTSLQTEKEHLFHKKTVTIYVSTQKGHRKQDLALPESQSALPGTEQASPVFGSGSLHGAQKLAGGWGHCGGINH